MITNLASRLEKCQTLGFLLMADFLCFFKKNSISAFSDFLENLQLHILKSLYQLTKYEPLKSSKTVRVTSHIDRVLMPIIWFIRVNKG